MGKFILDNSEIIHNSRPPLRWIANWAGSIGSKGILEISYMQEESKMHTLRYKYYCWLWDTFYPIYEKYGTYYKIDWDMSGPGWDDYDENGIPYWEKWDIWDYEDEETGDAFRIINANVQ